MLSHERVWAAIDRLAALHDLTPSGLAKRAGLDSTTFNKSKRFAADGRPRWPSTESLAKVMAATGASLDEFTALVQRPAEMAVRGTQTSIDRLTGHVPAASHAQMRQIPVLGLAQAGAGGFFDDAGFPAGTGWDAIPFPDGALDDNVYALEITGDSMEPLYRDGDRIIVSPLTNVRRGDRVVVKTRNGEVMAKILKRRTAATVELASANADHEDRELPLADIEWMARILWASQ